MNKKNINIVNAVNNKTIKLFLHDVIYKKFHWKLHYNL